MRERGVGVKAFNQPSHQVLKNAELESSVRIGKLIGFREGFTVSINGNGRNLLLNLRTVTPVGLYGCDCIDNLHAGNNFAESSVLSIQMLSILVHDKELTSGRVGRRGACHAQNTALMLQIVFNTVEEKFALNAVAGAAHTGAVRAAALDHEAGNDTVEDQAIIVIVVCQINEVVDALRSLIGVQFTFDNAAVFHGNLKSRIAHFNISPSWLARFDVWRLSQLQPVVYHIIFCPCTGLR